MVMSKSLLLLLNANSIIVLVLCLVGLRREKLLMINRLFNMINRLFNQKVVAE